MAATGNTYLVSKNAQNTFVPNNHQAVRNSEQYNRIVQSRSPPTRPNYQFFGYDQQQSYPQNVDSRQYVQILDQNHQNYSKRVSPGIQNQVTNARSQAHSHSPITIRSDSSQANKIRHRVTFSYTSNLGLRGLKINNKVSEGYPAQNIQNSYQQHPQNQQLLVQGPNSHAIVEHNEQNDVSAQNLMPKALWEHRFVEIYSKFEIFVQKFENVIEDIYYIDDLFDNVNDEEAWNDLRVRYSDMTQNFNTMREDIILVLEENKAAINSLSPQMIKQISDKQIQNQKQLLYQQNKDGEENQQQYDEENELPHQEGGQTGKSGSETNQLWQNRCLQLMQQHELLTKQNNQLKNEIQRLKAQQHEGFNEKKPRGSEHEGNSKVLEMQKNFNLIHSEYQKLEENYSKLSMQYSRVITELQNRASVNQEGGHQDYYQMEQQLGMAQSKINELYSELQSKNQANKQLEKQIEEYGQILEQNKMLLETVGKMNTDLESYQNQYKNQQKIVHEYEDSLEKYHNQNNLYAEKITQLEHQLNSQTTLLNKSTQLQKRIKQIETLREQERSLLNLIQKHQQSIEELIVKNQRATTQYQSVVRQKDEQVRVLQKFLEEERVDKEKMMKNNFEQRTAASAIQNITESAIFKERLQIQIQEIVSQKNRAIRLMTQDMDQIKQQLEVIQKDKLKQIKQIKLFFAEQEDKYIKKIQDKETNIKLLQDKIKSFENELSNRNLEISRFRHQSPINSFTITNEESKKYSELLDKKNHEIHQLRRTIEQKNLHSKDLQQKIYLLQQDVNCKIYEINSLKREVNDFINNKAEIDNLNNIIKKKNQQINEIRLTGVEIDQMKMNLQGLEREKLRLTEYLKQKTRECQGKDNTIQSLERKINVLTVQANSGSKKYSFEQLNPTVTNYENILKQKDNQIKGLKYQLEMYDTKISLGQKTIRDLNAKISNYQKSNAHYKSEIEKKVLKYETDLKDINKELKNVKEEKQELKTLLQNLQSKNSSLQKSFDERSTFFQRQSMKQKEKSSSFEQINTALLVDQQIFKNQIERLTKENRELNQKIKGLEGKIEGKNLAIHQLKGNYSKKERQQVKNYEEKMKRLQNQLKISSVKVRTMQQEITTLNRKVESVQTEKRSYRQKLLSEHSISKRQFVDFRSQWEFNNQEILEIDKFKLKDQSSSDLFERKVIYELKKQNDFLRRQLSNIGSISYSVNRFDSQAHQLSYQQEFLTDRSKQEDNQSGLYFKKKNKQLEERIDQLLKVNNELKGKITSVGTGGPNQLSIQFYKDQISKLQIEVSELQSKIKKLLVDHENVKDEITGHEYEAESLKDKVGEQNLKISELKNIIKNNEEIISQLKNSKTESNNQIQRLRQVSQKLKIEKDERIKKQKVIVELTSGKKMLEQEVTKLTNKINIQSSEIQRLKQTIQAKKSELDTRFNDSSQQIKKLKRRILQLEKQVQIYRLEQHSQQFNTSDNAFKLQKLRSFFTEIQSLVGQLPLDNKRSNQIVQQIRQQVSEGFTTVAMIEI